MRPPLSQPQCSCKKLVSPLLLPSGKLFDEWNRGTENFRAPVPLLSELQIVKGLVVHQLERQIPKELWAASTVHLRNAKTAGGSGEPKGQWSRQPFSRFSSRYYSEQKAKVKSLLSLLLPYKSCASVGTQRA